jgi:DNA-binding response OmpR family regulator
MNNRVMVLDDDEDILEIISYLLTEEGYKVLRLNNGANIQDHIRAFAPNLILMDVLLGEQNGIEICRMLKHEPETSELPIILISGTHNLSGSLYLDGAPDDFLAKPFDVDVLLKKVEQRLL